MVGSGPARRATDYRQTSAGVGMQEFEGLLMGLLPRGNRPAAHALTKMGIELLEQIPSLLKAQV
jgi:hypothetical protein